MRKATKDDDFVMDFCAGTSSRRIAYMPLDQQRKFVGCGVDFELLSAAKPDLLLTFVS